MGNTESDTKNGEEGTQGSESIGMLTEEEFYQLTLEQQQQYMAEYHRRRQKEENDQRRKERRQKPIEAINSIRGKIPFTRNTPDDAREYSNNGAHPQMLPPNGNGYHMVQATRDQFNQVDYHQPHPEQYNSRQHPLHHDPYKQGLELPYPPGNYATQSPGQYNYPPQQPYTHPQQQYQYTNGAPHASSNSSRNVHSSNQNQRSSRKQASSNNPHQTVNVMMYPSHTSRSSNNTSNMDPVKMMKSLKIEENDWETRWENDDNDDDSSEDEDKDTEETIVHYGGGASKHPFRPGMDGGHSSLGVGSATSINNNRMNELPVPPPSSNSMIPPYPTGGRPNNINRMPDEMIPSRRADVDPRYIQRGQWDDVSKGNIEDRPGVKMFSKLRVLGKGSFGKVVLVKKRSGPDRGQLYAMKILRKTHLYQKRQIERTKTERKVLSIVKHPFIMKLHFAFQTDDHLYFVLEYCPGGELFFHLSRYRRFPERVARFYAAELLLAIGHLHRRGIIFRDLKPENVLLDATGHVKLGDFGLSKDGISDPCQGAMSVCGTPEYMAPEVISRAGHGFCVDYWGLGMLVFEMMTSLPPWYTTDRSELSTRLLSAPLEIPDYMTPSSSHFVSALLERNPRKRLGVQGYISVTKHRFFKDMDWKQLASKRYQPPMNPCEGWRAKLNPGSNAGVTDNEIDGFTSNFDKHFTRMPVNTEDHQIEQHNSGSEYGSEDNENPFVGFTFDEIDNHATSSRRGNNAVTNTNTNSSSPQAMGSRKK